MPDSLVLRNAVVVLSVRPSVRLSHSWKVSQWLDIVKLSQQSEAIWFDFLYQNQLQNSDGSLRSRSDKYLEKMCDFRPITDHISKSHLENDVRYAQITRSTNMKSWSIEQWQYFFGISRYWSWRTGVKVQQRPFHLKSGCGWRKDEVRPLVRVSALCSLLCFDTDGWVTGRTRGV